MIQEAAKTETGSKPKVLVVDDNKISRKIIENELCVLDIELITLPDRESALEITAISQPEVVVLSAELHKESSYELCGMMKSNQITSDIPIILVARFDSESERNKALSSGADLICQLPIQKGSLATNVEQVIEKGHAVSIPQKVLVAEDSDTIRSIIASILTKAGHRVVEAVDGEEAWRLLGEMKDIDMIISDINMPNLDGYQLVKMIRASKEWELVPIIIASTFADKEQIVRLLNAGADDYLIKPFSSEEFLARIKAHQRVHQLYGELKIANKKLISFNESLERMVSFRTLELHEANMEAIMMLAVASEFRDTDTGNHVRRIADYTRELTLAMGYSLSKAEEISYCSILHDVGKIAIPDSILKKSGLLTDEEFTIMKEHTVHGESILSDSQFFKMAREVARSHHEKFDGSGYPDNLVEYQIPLSARVTAVADVFDALSNKRVYKEAWPEEKAAKQIIEWSGTMFDPLAIEAFVKLYERGVITKIRKKYN